MKNYYANSFAPLEQCRVIEVQHLPQGFKTVRTVEVVDEHGQHYMANRGDLFLTQEEAQTQLDIYTDTRRGAMMMEALNTINMLAPELINGFREAETALKYSTPDSDSPDAIARHNTAYKTISTFIEAMER